MNPNGILVTTLQQGHAKCVGKPVTCTTNSKPGGRVDQVGLGNHTQAPPGGTVIANIDPTVSTITEVTDLATTCRKANHNMFERTSANHPHRNRCKNTKYPPTHPSIHPLPYLDRMAHRRAWVVHRRDRTCVHLVPWERRTVRVVFYYPANCPWGDRWWQSNSMSTRCGGHSMGATYVSQSYL